MRTSILFPVVFFCYILQTNVKKFYSHLYTEHSLLLPKKKKKILIQNKVCVLDIPKSNFSDVEPVFQ